MHCSHMTVPQTPAAPAVCHSGVPHQESLVASRGNITEPWFLWTLSSWILRVLRGILHEEHPVCDHDCKKIIHSCTVQPQVWKQCRIPALKTNSCVCVCAHCTASAHTFNRAHRFIPKWRHGRYNLHTHPGRTGRFKKLIQALD